MLPPHLFEFDDEEDVGVGRFDFDKKSIFVAHCFLVKVIVIISILIMLKSLKSLCRPSIRTFANSLVDASFCSASSTHRLSYGQGGYCSLDLLHNNYNIEFETIW